MHQGKRERACAGEQQSACRLRHVRFPPLLSHEVILVAAAERAVTIFQPPPQQAKPPAIPIGMVYMRTISAMP
jgi:hypothetical protein